MSKFGAVALAAVFLSSSAPAAVQPFPAEFKTETIATNGARIYVRVGGSGPAVVLLHGYGETGDMWAPLAGRLARDHTVIVPDLRGLGLSSQPPGGYDQKTQGEDVARALDARPGAIHAGFEQFKAFDQDATDNKGFVANGMLAMPVLAVGGEKSFGPMMATVMRAAATNVQAAVVPNSGHWVMEENPAATIKLIEDFLR